MDSKERQLRRAEERLRREKEVRANKAIFALCVVLLVMVLFQSIGRAVRERNKREEASASSEFLSDEVLGYRDLVHEYAEQEGIGEYEDVLLAIMEVESRGTGSDVMQSSESKGLRAGTLEPEESIEQACYYYAELLKIADENGSDDRSVIQAYNFGPGYLIFVGENGGKHTRELAAEYARQKSDGETVEYTNDVAPDGWKYKYGNMYYVDLVEQHMP